MPEEPGAAVRVVALGRQRGDQLPEVPVVGFPGMHPIPAARERAEPCNCFLAVVVETFAVARVGGLPFTRHAVGDRADATPLRELVVVLGRVHAVLSNASPDERDTHRGHLVLGTYAE